MRDPEVVVVVRTLGKERLDTLKAALHSIRRQGYPNVRAVVVLDSRATDEDERTRELRELAGLLGDVLPGGEGLILSRGRGQADAAMTGIRAVDFPFFKVPAFRPEAFVGLLDDDDVLRSWWAERLVNGLRDHPECPVAHCDVRVMLCNEKNEPTTKGPIYEGIFDYEDLCEQNRKPNNAFLYRRSVFEHDGFRTEDEPLDDWGLLLRLAKEGVRFAYVPGVGAEYRIKHDEARFRAQAKMDAMRPEILRRYGA